MQQVFLNAIFHVEPRVLERQLLPLSLWHVYVLLAADSPYVRKNVPEKTIGDMVFAVSVCSQLWTADGTWTPAPDAKDVSEWGRSWTEKHPDTEDLNREDAALQLWINEYSQCPRRKSKFAPGEGLSEERSPWPLIVQAKLAPRCGESRAWNMPIPLALAYYFADMEADGDTSLLSDVDLKQLEYKKAWIAQKKAEMDAKAKAGT